VVGDGCLALLLIEVFHSAQIRVLTHIGTFELGALQAGPF
jgi:hypothetical protein